MKINTTIRKKFRVSNKVKKVASKDRFRLCIFRSTKNISAQIIDDSKKQYFIDCSNKDLQGVILAIKNSDFYIGNNSGPLNLSAALGIKTFGLIANDPVSELKYSNIKPITPEGYVDNIWIRDRMGMKKLKPNYVFNQIQKNLSS